MRAFLPALAFTLIAVGATPAGAQDAVHGSVLTGTRLEITAESEVAAAPDLAIISAGVVTDAPSAAEALKLNAERMNAVMAAVKSAGIADRDVQTSNLSINPQYDYQERKAPTVSGYQATNTVTVRLNDLTAVGKVVDALVSAGANQLNGPNFDIKNPDVLMDRARADALAKARARADIYAKAANMSIKRIVSINEQAHHSAPPMPMRMMAMEKADAAGTSVATGTMSLNMSLNVVFELQ